MSNSLSRVRIIALTVVAAAGIAPAGGCLPAADVHSFYGREFVLYDGTAKENTPPIAVEASTLEPAEERRQLDAELAGLDRAIRAGLDEDGALARRRAAVEARLIELNDRG